MSIASVALSPVREESFYFPCRIWDQFGSWSRDSILIFITFSGSVIPMHVLESDSIASVKLRIQTYKGIFVKKQKLVFEGKELSRNNSCVRDYGVADGNILHLVLRLSNLLTITVRTVSGRVFELHVDRKRNVAYLKQQITNRGKDFLDLKDQELICNGEVLEDERLINDISGSNDAVIHLLVRKSAKVRAKRLEKDFEVSIETSDFAEADSVYARDHQEQIEFEKLQFEAGNPLRRDSLLEPLIVNPKVELSPAIKQLIDYTFEGLKKGNPPIRSSEGSGGAYLMQDSSGRKYVSVFKPMDEEPMAVNNPLGLPLSTNGEGLKKGTRVGEGALREVAAYILDHPRGGRRTLGDEEKGFSGVPPTVMVKCMHKGFNYPDGYDCTSKNVKIGSLQIFVKNSGSCEDMGPRDFPVEEVHKISVLDIRLANADRHTGNILVSRDTDDGQIVLIPIDHGYCLPENFEDCTFDWLYWPQSREPYSPDTLEYIKSIDAEQDIELLKFYGWELSVECARTLRISTMLLKKGAERRLSPFAIGSIMCRQTLKKESAIEQIVEEAQDSMLPETSEAAFLESVSLIMDSRLDELHV